VAWGLSTGRWNSAAALAQQMRADGYRWLALELDDYGNAARWPAFRESCHASEILAGPWFTDGGNIAQTPADADFAIAELESEDDYRGIIAVRDAGTLPSCPKAVITNFTPLTDAQGVPLPQKAKPLIDAGFRCLTEAYLGDNPNARPDRLAFTASQLGWPMAQPMFGIYNKPLADYVGWMQGGWSVYLCEYL
jgi:hypothetical protein